MRRQRIAGEGARADQQLRARVPDDVKARFRAWYEHHGLSESEAVRRAVERIMRQEPLPSEPPAPAG